MSPFKHKVALYFLRGTTAQRRPALDWYALRTLRNPRRRARVAMSILYKETQIQIMGVITHT